MNANKKPKTTALVPVVKAGAALPAKRLVDENRLYQDWLARLSPRSRRAYERDARYFAEFLDLQTGAQAAGRLKGMEHGDANMVVLEYRTSLVNKGLASATVNRRLAAIRSLVKLGNTLGYIPWSISISRVKQEKRRDMSGPGEEAVGQIFETTSGDDWKSRRDHAMLRLMYGSGLRRSEVVSLDVSDVDMAKCAVLVQGKGRKEKAPIDFGDRAKKALERWLAVRGEVAGEPALFLNDKQQHRLADSGLYDIVTDLGKQLGLVDERGRSKVRPHGLRHSSGTKVIQEQGMVAGQAFLRHASPQTTMGYFDKSKAVARKAVDMLDKEEGKPAKDDEARTET